jgi:GNAT superfamily N-acetyltransferase
MIVVREATRDDAPEFASMWLKLLYDNAQWAPTSDVPTTENLKHYMEIFHEYVSGYKDGIVMLAFDDDTPVGGLMGGEADFMTQRQLGRCAFIFGEWVHPDHRNQGVARELELAAYRWAQKNSNFDAVVYSIMAGNPNQQRIESGKAGGIPTHSETWYYTKIEDQKDG